MNIDLINAELQDVALTQQQEEIDLTYQDFLDIINSYHDMMMYSSNSYDEDAIFYGVN
jgi:tRNA(Phe) wybutosine-synthesizing methylase Tyw3